MIFFLLKRLFLVSVVSSRIASHESVKESEIDNNVHHSTSKLLDELLSEYNPTVRPSKFSTRLPFRCFICFKKSIC